MVTSAGKPVDAFFVEFDGESRLFIVKAPKGEKYPLRELETVTSEEIVAQAGGPLIVNHEAEAVNRFDQGFEKSSTFRLGVADTLRIFWSRIRQSGPRDIFRMDYDLIKKVPGPVVTLSFQGDDPFIMNASNIGKPQRVYLVYINAAGKNVFRQSQDHGITWGDETLIDDTLVTDHILAEANFDDPLTDRDDVQVVQVRT